jgi:hypothetical protein
VRLSSADQAETPDGGVITSTRNEDYHKGYPGKVDCDCRGVSRSVDGGSTFADSQPAPALVGPVCQATMVTVPTAGGGRTIFHANPGEQPALSRSTSGVRSGIPLACGRPRYGQRVEVAAERPGVGHGAALGRWGQNLGGINCPEWTRRASSPQQLSSWDQARVKLAVPTGPCWRRIAFQAYSYSCLTTVPEPGFIGLAYETVLPGSDIKPGASANNVVFTLVPQNFTG